MDSGGSSALPIREAAAHAKDEAVQRVMREFDFAISRRTDRAFALLMAAQWLFGIVIAVWVTPRTWMGAQVAPAQALEIAVLGGGAISLAAILLAWKYPGTRLSRHVIAVCQLLYSSLLIFLTGGRIETHFHIFGSLAFLAFYLDWMVLLTGSLVAFLDHVLRNMYAPCTLFGMHHHMAPYRWLEHTGWIVFCDVFLIGSCLSRVRKMTVIARQQVEQGTLLHQAYTDSLTQLPNRLRFQMEVERRLNPQEGEPQPFSILYIDLDRFKEVNDTLGHAAGDQLLVGASERLRDSLVPQALLARIGGDEFVAVLPGVAEEATLVAMAQELITALMLPIEIAGTAVQLGASIGISQFPKDGSSEEELLHKADSAMYAVKRQGRRGYAFYKSSTTPEDEQGVEEQQALESAMVNHEFEMHYQPLVDAAGNVDGVEALMRWNSPTRGMVPPMDFIPSAERTGHIVALGQIALEQVCAQIAAWQSESIPFGKVAVNLSPRQLEHPSFLRDLDAAVLRHGIRSTWLCFEITETAFAVSPRLVEEQMRALQHRGIQVSLDDFGTGYSSLGRLEELRFDVLKIDRMFVSRMREGSTGYRVVETIIRIAHLLGMSVVAEGVETAEQQRLLERLGCNAMQGYYFSRPMAVAVTTEYLKQAALCGEASVRASNGQRSCLPAPGDGGESCGAKSDEEASELGHGALAAVLAMPVTP
ncbi:bifunctional diguanylate cyclase/phosphodiesterase [Acidipila sp. EB88]|uniref:putative bifunctional diguanylate cyclase/phosphodiesterase n=1 Tax=Acidipila sp. EB88 TaxID=2305226 RepID=UPI001315227C|nr:EAL domain-containing protein [Acidipila sp. EB88]